MNDAEVQRADYPRCARRTNATALPPAVKTAFDTLVGREVEEATGLPRRAPSRRNFTIVHEL